ncbi:protein PYRICULARIA ORYZAE RESISTANCE 21-like [Ziziphus jujuba]|uniref:Protein PYRICULARIA ORYZAE RESISTANCE 21-like n=1 Tax=Ziziphus jujuba TaxID=326968 RepID=A0A6P6FTW7_ZIZJJ|nr:protein PYRICULARIA ORYZAE RESISTANCE 21-like isoform X1 [Ziziphus jujuba var. spinosa]XP_048332256.1 protein PYRICULARIA ORYZAE RESISTANCE 21-like [Ziziphus jujuba]
MGGEKQVTTMVLKVDLQCCKCYKKVKKILCKIPQIHDQVYDEKNDTVTIKVLCCSPEKIKEKIICKGGGCITSIDIIVPEKQKPKPSEKTKEPEKLKEPEKPKEQEKPKAPENPPCQRPSPPHPQVLVRIGVCCQQCYSGYPGGPCLHCHAWPPPCYKYYGYCGRPVFDSCGCGRNCYTSHCDTQGCTIM